MILEKNNKLTLSKANNITMQTEYNGIEIVVHSVEEIEQIIETNISSRFYQVFQDISGINHFSNTKKQSNKDDEQEFILPMTIFDLQENNMQKTTFIQGMSYSEPMSRLEQGMSNSPPSFQDIQRARDIIPRQFNEV